MSHSVYRHNDYSIPLDFLDCVKTRNDISGIKYLSEFTGCYNVALWDENCNLECKNSRVIKV